MLAVILAVALVARVAVVVFTPDYQALFDSGDYDRHARSIAAGDGFPPSVFAAAGGPSAFRPPLYPYLLGGVYAVSGDSMTAGRLAEALLGVLVVLLVYVVGRSGWDRRTGLIAAALAAAFPPLVLLNASLVTEPLFLVLELSAVAAVLLHRRTEDWRWAAAAGFACGLAALTRSNGLLLILPVMLGVWWPARRRLGGRALVAPAVALVAAALAIVPWTIRNLIEFDRLVPIANQSGFALAGQYNDEARGNREFRATWVAPAVTTRYAPIYRRRDLNEAELDSKLRSKAREYAVDHPRYVLKATALNTLRALELIDSAPTPTKADLRQRGLGSVAGEVDRISFYVACLLAIAGVVVLVRRGRSRRGPLFLWLVPVLMLAAAVPILGSPRYRAPTEPFVLLLAAIALGALTARRREAA